MTEVDLSGRIPYYPTLPLPLMPRRLRTNHVYKFLTGTARDALGGADSEILNASEVYDSPVKLRESELPRRAFSRKGRRKRERNESVGKNARERESEYEREIFIMRIGREKKGGRKRALERFSR